MYFLVISFFISVSISLQGDFLTKFEYAKMLYNDPRGISCRKCHGDNGETLSVFNYYSHYRRGKHEREIVIRPINKLSFREFKRGLSRRIRFMPIYRLSDKEIEAIYFYIKKASGKKEKKQEETNSSL